MDSRLRVAGGHRGVKFMKAADSFFLFNLELSDSFSEGHKLLFHRTFAHGATHGSGVGTSQRERHGRGDDIGRSGGGWTRTGGEFGVLGRGHERFGLFVKVWGIVLIIIRIM